MRLVDLMNYNTNIKIAGNIITLKTYQQDQLYGYIKSNDSGPNKLDQLIKEIQLQLLDPKLNIKEKDQLQLQLKINIYNSDQAKKERFEKSCKRAKARIFDLVACNADQWNDYEGDKQYLKFYTLTFKENETDLEKANLEITKFFKRLSWAAYHVRKNVIKYIAVPELQKRGAWHYHIIIFNIKYYPYNNFIDPADPKKEKKGLKDTWGLGGLYVNAVRSGLDPTTMAKYVTKYISKGIKIKEGSENTIINNNDLKEGDKLLGDYENYKKLNMQNKKRYQCSRGLIKPFESKVKITRGDQGIIYSYMVDHAQDKHTGGKNVYFNNIENEHRGSISILVVEIDPAAIDDLKLLIDQIYRYNRIKNSRPYNVNWDKIKIERSKYIGDTRKYKRDQEDLRQEILYRAMLMRG